MLRYEKNKNGIDIIYNDEVIFKHLYLRPSFYLGIGYESIESYRGNFKIEDFIEQRIGLRDFKITGDTISFYNNEIFLDIEFIEADSRLTMKLTSSEGYNRFWMRLDALKEEKVFGCGEQASYFNLRGRNFPLWTSEPGVGRDKNSLTTFYANKEDKAGGDYYNTYYPEQTFVSTRKYWLHADSYAYAEFNFRFPQFHELFFWEIPNEIVLSFDNPSIIICSILEYD